MFSKHIVPVLLAGTMIAFSTTNLAQAPVEDRSVPANSNRSGSQAQSALSEDAGVQLYLELQTLRQEVTALRGLIEELNYQIDQLSSRQTNDYANLDRRILELSQGGVSVVSDGNSNSNAAAATSSSSATPTIANNGMEASELYNRAFASLRSGDREAALSQFGDLVEQYPNDAVAGDALYWMGETQWVGAAYEDARQAFVSLIERFPEHRRYGDALYKLGLIYHQLGDNSAAQQYLQRAVALGGDVGARAEEFLSQNMTP
jgi:tol-pal system protein YbgF